MAVSSEADPSPALTEHFADLDDPRRENSTDYPLHEIIVLTICVLTICVLTICGVICGADESGSIANFGEAKNWGGKEGVAGAVFGTGERNSVAQHDWTVHDWTVHDWTVLWPARSRSVRGAVFEVGTRGL